jgi:AhpD family alkylhydroperoxidase
MTYRTKIADMRAEIRAMNKLIPEAAAGFGQLSRAVKENGPLSVRQKEWVALGMAIAQRCEPCINFHVEALMKAGGTREELGDILGMAIQMGGGPALMYAAHALASWDELAAPAMAAE